MFGKLKSLFQKTEDEVNLKLSTRIKTAVVGKASLSDDEIEDITWNLQLEIMQNDVAVPVAERITAELKEKLRNKEFKNPKEEIRAILREVLLDILDAEPVDIVRFAKTNDKPVKIVFFGINGCGKTTTIAKVAKLLLNNGLTVVLAAGDTFRAGAIEQLEKHAQNLGVKVIKHKREGDPAAVVYDAVEHAKSKDIDVVLADTSGRMQSDVDLMNEMEKIIRVNSPDMKIFVGDALTGNDAVEQAEKFNEKIGIDAAILTKTDASKGGCALSIAHVTGKPIVFLGTGQKYEDLRAFVPEEFISGIL